MKTTGLRLFRFKCSGIHPPLVFATIITTPLLIAFFILGMNGSNAQATDEAGVSISPVTFELNANPEDILTNQVKVFNPTDFPQSITMQMEDFVPVGEEGNIALEEPDENSTYSLASWATVTPEEFTLQPGEQQIVSFILELPQNAEPGGHYGSLVAFVSGGTTNVTGSSIGSKRGALLLLRVSGDIQEEIIVNTFSANSFQETGPVIFDLKFENIGNVHVKPAGFITITDQFGKQVAELEIPQNNVIPDATRKATTTWEKEDLMGRFTATVVANYGSTDKKTVTDVISFTVFPWKKAAVISGILLAILIVLYLIRERLALAFKILLGKKP